MIYTPKNKLLAVMVRAAELCLFVCDQLFFFLLRPLPVRTPNKILAVRLDAIGDFVIWLSAAKEIRRIHAGAEIVLLGNDLWTGLAKELPWFDAVWPLNRKRFFMNPFYRYRMLNKVRRAGFSLALNAVFSRDYFVGDAVLRASGSPVRIGFAGNLENITPWQKGISDTWYTTLVASAPRHQLEEDTDFVRALGDVSYSAGLPELPRFSVPEGFPLKTYYVMVLGAGHEMRQWPLGNFQELARRIHAKTGLPVVLGGGRKERDLARSFAAGAGVPVTDMTGRTSLKDLAAIIARARFVVGNDTGAIHIAVATATTSVCILGGAHPGRYVPYPSVLQAPVRVVMHTMGCFSCDWHCVHDEAGVVPCIRLITVDEVWREVQKIL